MTLRKSTRKEIHRFAMKCYSIGKEEGKKIKWKIEDIHTILDALFFYRDCNLNDKTNLKRTDKAIKFMREEQKHEM